MSIPTLKRTAACLVIILIGNVAAAQSIDGRWAAGPFACDGEAFTRPETPLIVRAMSVRWFDSNCTIVSSYKVNQTLYLQGRCLSAGRMETIPIMLDLRGDRLRVGWNREPIQEMQRCR